jgi:hypothetical protein
MTTTGKVVDLRTRSGYQPDFAALARRRFIAARRALDLSPTALAEMLTPLVGWTVSAKAVEGWETDSIPPGEVLVAADNMASASSPDRQYQVPTSEHPLGSVLGAIPHSFSADALAGFWVTSFQFTSGLNPNWKRHVDIAQISPESDRFVMISNHPPMPRSEGRASPFYNTIEAQLANRHLVGHWKNSSDTRYFGTFHLAVLPGETVMAGYYTGFASDVEVSTGPWKWVRIDEDSIAGMDVSKVKLRDPAELGARIENHSQYEPALTLADIEQEH